MQEYVEAIHTGKSEVADAYSHRYIGSLVADIHRTLLYGGIYASPADFSNPEGSVSLVHQAAPIAFLIEQAGGLALDGRARILSQQPASINEPVPLFCGSALNVMELQDFYDRADADEAAVHAANYNVRKGAPTPRRDNPKARGRMGRRVGAHNVQPTGGANNVQPVGGRLGLRRLGRRSSEEASSSRTAVRSFATELDMHNVADGVMQHGVWLQRGATLIERSVALGVCMSGALTSNESQGFLEGIKYII